MMYPQHRLLSALLVLPLCLLPSSTSGFSTSQHQYASVIQPQSTAPQSTTTSKRRNRVDSSTVLWRVDEDSLLEETSEEQPTLGKLPPVIQHIANERQEFNMNLGKAMDTLRKDMPEILRASPDFSIYHPDIQVIDPSGVRLTGLDNYKSALAFFQTFVKFWFGSTSRLQYRMVYDFCRSSIRVSWNVVLIPKVPLGPRALFLDGVSHYKLDPSSGKIIEHKIEKLVMNNTPVAPPYGIFGMLQQDMAGQPRLGVPVPT